MTSPSLRPLACLLALTILAACGSSEPSDFSSSVTAKEWSSGEISTLIGEAAQTDRFGANLFETTDMLSPGEKAVIGLALSNSYARSQADLVRGSTLLNEACDEGVDRACAEVAHLLLRSRSADNGNAISTLDRVCKNGTMTGCYRLTWHFVEGKFVQADPDRALYYAGLACADPSELSCPYAGRTIVEIDPNASKSMLEKSCKAGLSLGCYNLALGYEDKAYEEEAEAATLARFEALCADGYTNGCRKVVQFHDEGWAQSAMIETAVQVTDERCHLFGSENACLQMVRYYLDDAESQPRDLERYIYIAGTMCLNGLDYTCWWIGDRYDSFNDPEAKKLALAVLRELCQADRPDTCGKVAEIEIASRNFQPSGDDLSNDVDDRACRLGDGEACRRAGWNYALGEQGRAQDVEQAALMFMIGCENGHGVSCVDRGSLYEYALHGMEKDVAEATRMYERACKLDTPFACDQYQQAVTSLQ